MKFKIQKPTFLFLIIILLFLANTACGGRTLSNLGSNNSGKVETNTSQISNQESSVKENISSNSSGFHYEIQNVNFVREKVLQITAMAMMGLMT